MTDTKSETDLPKQRVGSNTLAVHGLEEHIMQVSLISVIIVSFMLFIVLLSLMQYFFQRISDSQFMFLKNNLPNLLGLCHFPLNA